MRATIGLLLLVVLAQGYVNYRHQQTVRQLTAVVRAHVLHLQQVDRANDAQRAFNEAQIGFNNEVLRHMGAR